MEESRRERKRNLTHTNILHSAKVLFEDNGLDGVTVLDICNSADIAKSTFFLHFDSLDELKMELISDEIEDLFKVFESEGKDYSVLAIGNKLVDDFAAYPSLYMRLFVKLIFSGKNEGLMRIYGLLTEYVAKAERYGAAREKLTAEELTACLFGSCFGTILQSYLTGEKFDTQVIKKSLSNIESYFINNKNNA